MQTKNTMLSVGGRYLYGKSNRSECNGVMHFGSGDISFTRDFYQVRAGFGAFTFLDEVQILRGKPRFFLYDSHGIFATAGGELNFSLFDQEWKISTDLFFGHGRVENGDMYYFYGRPDNFFIFGGRANLSAPYGFSLFTLGGNLSLDMSTQTNTIVGDCNATLAAFFLAKEFLLPVADTFSIIPFAGYVYLSAYGKTWLSSENQTYALFPYKFVGGHFDEDIHFFSVGNSLAIKKGGCNFSVDFLYLFCFRNTASGEYAYQFKKNLFYDGSAENGNLPLPDTAGIHIFAGNIEISYRFAVHKHLTPTIRLSKMIAAAILNQATTDFLHTAFSSYSTVTSSAASDSSADESHTAETIKKALLSGTSLSIKIAL